jgi:hypothetical protein
MKVIATAVGALAVAWAVLLFGLGNVGLQRSVSIGAQVLVEDYLPITLAAAAVAFVVSLLGSAPARFEARDTIACGMARPSECPSAAQARLTATQMFMTCTERPVWRRQSGRIAHFLTIRYSTRTKSTPGGHIRPISTQPCAISGRCVHVVNIVHGLMQPAGCLHPGLVALTVAART